MKYQRKSFSVSPGAANISQENWERTFGKKARGAVFAEHSEHAAERRQKQTVPVSGVWTRTHDEDLPSLIGPGTRRWTVFEVLVEVEGKWRLLQTHRTLPIDQTISYITEPHGIEKAPEDKL